MIERERLRDDLAEALHDTLHFGTPGPGDHDLAIADALLGREPIAGLIRVADLALRDWPRIRHDASSELYEAVAAMEAR